MRLKVMITLNTAWNLVNFRSGLIRALIAHGYEVVAVAPVDEYASRLEELGCRYIPLPMDNKGTHPGRDLILLARFIRLMQIEKPDVYLGYTVKPNIYGSLAAHAIGVPVINNVAGLGSAFIKSGWLNSLVKSLYKLAFLRSRKVFFQNEDDWRLFTASGLVAESIADRLPGSGIDLQTFLPLPLPAGPSIRFMLIGRMLWDKGVGEFIEAVRLLKQRGLNAEYLLLGFVDVQNPTAISRKQIDQWVNEGLVQYLGVSDNVCDEIARVDCIVLPSYREGVPRTLLEAAAMARPIITTDAVGCRDVVDHGLNGFLCRPRDAADLADKMAQMVVMSPAKRQLMGQKGREKVAQKFDERIVVDKYLKSIRAILVVNEEKTV